MTTTKHFLTIYPTSATMHYSELYRTDMGATIHRYLSGELDSVMHLTMAELDAIAEAVNNGTLPSRAAVRGVEPPVDEWVDPLGRIVGDIVVARNNGNEFRILEVRRDPKQHGEYAAEYRVVHPEGRPEAVTLWRSSVNFYRP